MKTQPLSQRSLQLHRAPLDARPPAARARPSGPAADDGFTPYTPPPVRLDVPKVERPDLSGAKVFGRPVDPTSAHDLFWHYFGGRPAPTNNDDARAMMKELAEKLAPFGFKVEPVEHERMDKVTITSPSGKLEQVDLIYAMGAEPGVQRLQWLPSNSIGPSAPGGAVDPNFVSGILAMFEPTNEGIRKAVEELKKKPGYERVKLLEHPERLDKLDFGDGQVVDVILGAGGENPRWGWLPD